MRPLARFAELARNAFALAVLAPLALVPLWFAVRLVYALVYSGLIVPVGGFALLGVIACLCAYSWGGRA